MTSQFGVHLSVVLLTLAAVMAAVGLHYEGLNSLERWLSRSTGPHRRRVLRAVIWLMALHVAEVWLFGGTYLLALAIPGAGTISGAPAAGILDAVYLSAMSFSTVGFGDVAPQGAIRFIAGTEAVLGLFLRVVGDLRLPGDGGELERGPTTDAADAEAVTRRVRFDSTSRTDR